jgi:hypothetical protein
MGWEVLVIWFFGFMIAAKVYDSHKEAADNILKKIKDYIFGKTE